VIGWDPDGNGRGEPVARWRKPAGPEQPAAVPATSDDFGGSGLGVQWQWQGNPDPAWFSLAASPGALRLLAQPLPAGAGNLWSVPSLLLQKVHADTFTATVKLVYHPARVGERAGLLVFGTDYAWVGVEQTAAGPVVAVSSCADAPAGEQEHRLESRPAGSGPVWLRLEWRPDGTCRFASSPDGAAFTPLGSEFVARPGRWVGAKIGLFASAAGAGSPTGSADFSSFAVLPLLAP
jgi:beta-xylosidase